MAITRDNDYFQFLDSGLILEAPTPVEIGLFGRRRLGFSLSFPRGAATTRRADRWLNPSADRPGKQVLSMTYFEIYRVTNGVPQPRLRVAQTRVQAEIAAKRQAAIHDLPIVECEILPAKSRRRDICL